MKLRDMARVFIKQFFWGGYVSPWWMLTLKWHLRDNNKLKVGFGPVTTGEWDLAERKWRIDPIVNHINRHDERYVAGIFFKPSQMATFDMIVIVKKFNPAFIPVIEQLKRQGKKFIYDIVDNPNCGKPYDYYYRDHAQFLSCMDGFILSSPLHAMILTCYVKPQILIEHPIIHGIQKKNYHAGKTVNILAHGYYENLKIIHSLESLIMSISQATGVKITLYYHSEIVKQNTKHVKYIKWSVKNSFTTMEHMDVAISIKKLDVLHQKTKPSTKLISYMAAGLPVICTPTVADRMIMQHGVNGYFAETFDDWKRHISALATNASLRQQIGRAARADVIDRYSIPAMSGLYLAFFDRVVADEQTV